MPLFSNHSTPLAHNIQQLYGARGAYWLKNLPEIIDEIASLHHLSQLKPLNNLSYHYVLSGFQDQQPIILKLGFDQDILKKEAAALRVFSGFGATSILAESRGWLLLKRAVPGCSLKTYFPSQDELAVSIVCEVMQRLHQAPLPQASFVTIDNWLSILNQDWDMDSHDLQRARLLNDHLLATSAKPVLLHGDLHHDNILQNGNEWMVIDPKGVIGEPIFEVAAFLRNPIPELIVHPDMLMITQRRIQQFADRLGCSYQRIAQWCFVQAVLAQIWVLEDNLPQHLDYFKQLTNIFRELR
jgi:streptomycin 6-kinase